MISTNEALEIVRPASFEDKGLMDLLARVGQDVLYQNTGSYLIGLVKQSDYAKLIKQVEPGKPLEFRYEVEDYVRENMKDALKTRLQIKTINPPDNSRSSRGSVALKIGEEASVVLEAERMKFFASFGCENLYAPTEHSFVTVSPVGDENTKALRSRLISSGIVNRGVIIQPAMPVAILPSHQF